MSEAAVAAARNLVDSFKSGDLDAAFANVHPEGVIHEADELWYAGDFVGPDGFREIIETMSSRLQIEVGDYEVFDTAGEETFMKVNVTFTSPETGRRLEMPIVEIYRAKDGKLIDMDIFYKDTAAVIALATETAPATA